MSSSDIVVQTLDDAFVRKHYDDFLRVDSTAVSEGHLEVWRASNYRKEISGKWILSVCALDQERLVGYRVVSKLSPLSMHVHGHRLSVDVSWRGRGVATQLIEYSELLAKKMGFVGITNYIHSRNIPSQRFFMKKGYAMIDDSFGHKSLYMKSIV